jgi:hypothetical protein
MGEITQSRKGSEREWERNKPERQGEGSEIEENTEELDEEEHEYSIPPSHLDRRFAPNSLSREIDTSIEVEDRDLEVEALSPLDAPVWPFAIGRGEEASCARLLPRG